MGMFRTHIRIVNRSNPQRCVHLRRSGTWVKMQILIWQLWGGDLSSALQSSSQVMSMLGVTPTSQTA